MNKYISYLKSFRKAVSEYIESPDIKHRNYCVKRAVFHGVRVVNSQPKETLITKDDYEERLEFISVVNALIGLLTPKDFMNIFPIVKEYNGHKWGSKDYFYTKEYIDALNQGNPIGSEDKVLEFLWEYYNWEITEFVVSSMTCISDLRRFEGKPSLMEEWAAEQGIKTYSMYTDDKGNQFLLDKETGDTTKASKPRPRHLKIIK